MNTKKHQVDLMSREKSDGNVEDDFNANFVNTNESASSRVAAIMEPVDVENAGNMSSKSLAEGASASLPSVEELKMDVPMKSYNAKQEQPVQRKLRKMYFVVAALVVLLVVIVLAMGLTLGKNNKSTSSSATSSNGANTGGSGSGTGNSGTDSATRKSTLSEVIAFLSSNGISDANVLKNPTTPQYQAAQWLATTDPLNLAVPKSADTTDGYGFVSRYVLTLDYIALGGPNWDYQSNFLSGEDVCYWQFRPLSLGVYCEKPGQPLLLILPANNLIGEIPSENGKLTSLQALNLANNGFDKTPFPTEAICSMTNLEILSLPFNNFEGSIPTCLGGLSKLDYIHLGANNLKEGIPEEICKLSNLSELILINNLLTGRIPTCLGNIPLQLLAISNNDMEGSLPSELKNLKQTLKFLYIDDNMFTGEVIPILNELTLLAEVFASGNEFIDSIDETTFADHLDLNMTDLSHNNLTFNNFPAALLSHESLIVLDLSDNKLKGTLPSSLGAVNAELSFLSLFGNNLSGQLSPSLFSNLPFLVHLDVADNQFTGPMPTFDSKWLSLLFLSNNNFDAGPLDPTFGNLTRLTELSLRGTNRTGPLPQFISQLQNLDLLDLSTNSFTGTIPSSYSDLITLNYLLLNGNAGINGTIPSGFSQLEQLFFVYLDGTRITGSLQTLCDLPFLGGAPSIVGDNTGEIFADCAGTDPQVECSCNVCQCCPAESVGGCSLPEGLGNVDLVWERQFRRYESPDFDPSSKTTKPVNQTKRRF